MLTSDTNKCLEIEASRVKCDLQVNSEENLAHIKSQVSQNIGKEDSVLFVDLCRERYLNEWVKCLGLDFYTQANILTLISKSCLVPANALERQELLTKLISVKSNLINFICSVLGKLRTRYKFSKCFNNLRVLWDILLTIRFIFEAFPALSRDFVDVVLPRMRIFLAEDGEGIEQIIRFVDCLEKHVSSHCSTTCGSSAFAFFERSKCFQSSLGPNHVDFLSLKKR